MTRFDTLKASYLLPLLGALLLLPGCPKKGEILPAPDPRRPKEVKAEKVDTGPTDCAIVDATRLPSAVPYPERSIAEAQNLANEGFSDLQRSEDRKKQKVEREELLTNAVELFGKALAADPYNVHATYNLAAAYARIDRHQCTINLLERLVELRKLPSQKGKVEEKLDRLLGRGRFRGRLDPDFIKMRDMEPFREVIKKFCPSLPKGASLDQLNQC